MKNENVLEKLDTNIEQLTGSFGKMSVEEIAEELDYMFGEGDDDFIEEAEQIQKMCNNYLHGKLVVRDITTKQIIALELIDKNGVNWIKDYIGNTGGFGSLQDGLIEYDQDNDIYLADTETINWWIDIIDRQKNVDEEIDNIRQNFGDEIAEQLISNSADGDLESTINGIEFAINQFYGE